MLNKATYRRSPYDLLGKIYDAALNPELWQPFVDKLTEVVDARSGRIYIHNLKTKQVPFSVTNGYPEAAVEAHCKYFIKIDPWVEKLAKLPVGLMCSSHLVTPDSYLTSTEYYNDFLAPFDLHYAAGGFVSRNAETVVQLGVQRSKQAGNFGVEDLGILTTIRPHLQRAMEISQRLEAIECKQNIVTELLNRLQVGVILIDDKGNPYYINQRGEEIIQDIEGVFFSGQGLRTKSSRETLQLRRLVYEATQTGLGLGLYAGGSMVLTDSMGNQVVQVMVAPLAMEQRGLDLGTSRACAVIFLTHPQSQRLLPVEILQVMYGLTPAESRLAVELAEGSSLEQIADQHQTSRHTVRSQLKAVFAKTGTNNQSGLMRNLLSNPAAKFRPG